MPEYADITAFHEWLNWLEEISNSTYPDYQTLMFYEIRDKLECLPKIVRCKDCFANGCCSVQIDLGMGDEGYCSKGRKETRC